MSLVTTLIKSIMWGSIPLSFLLFISFSSSWRLHYKYPSLIFNFIIINFYKRSCLWICICLWRLMPLKDCLCFGGVLVLCLSLSGRTPLRNIHLLICVDYFCKWTLCSYLCEGHIVIVLLVVGMHVWLCKSMCMWVLVSKYFQVSMWVPQCVVYIFICIQLFNRYIVSLSLRICF